MNLPLSSSTTQSQTRQDESTSRPTSGSQLLEKSRPLVSFVQNTTTSGPVASQANQASSEESSPSYRRRLVAGSQTSGQASNPLGSNEPTSSGTVKIGESQQQQHNRSDQFGNSSQGLGQEHQHLITRTSGCCGLVNMSKTTRLITAYFLAELVGTFLLVAIGDGAISAYVLTKQKVDLLGTCLSFGVGAMIGTFASAKISGAHLNPAASLALALDGKLKWKLVPIYLLAQYLGGFLAAVMLMVNNWEAINALDGGQRSAFGSANSTGNIFATYPGAWVSPWAALLDQIIGTAILLFSLSALGDKRNSGLEERHQPLVIALIIGLVCLAFSPNCGAIFNPARDLAPRVVTYVFGYPSVFEPVRGFYWLLAGVLGPHIGAIIGLFAYKILIGSQLELKSQLAGEESCDFNACTNTNHHINNNCHCHLEKFQSRKMASGGAGNYALRAETNLEGGTNYGAAVLRH